MFKGLTVRRLCKSFGVKGLTISEAEPKSVIEYIVSNDRDTVQGNHRRHHPLPSVTHMTFFCWFFKTGERETRDWNIFLHLQCVLQWEF
jgi:hypothetical protein